MTTAQQDRIDELTEALQRIVQWSEAYPLNIFPEPDFEKAAELLKAGGITLDAISASNMRHVVEGVGKIARDALARRGTDRGIEGDHESGDGREQERSALHRTLDETADMKIVSDHGFPKDESASDSPLASFKNERDYVKQAGRSKTTIAALDWAVSEIEALARFLAMAIDERDELVGKVDAERWPKDWSVQARKRLDALGSVE